MKVPSRGARSHSKAPSCEHVPQFVSFQRALRLLHLKLAPGAERHHVRRCARDQELAGTKASHHLVCPSRLPIKSGSGDASKWCWWKVWLVGGRNQSRAALRVPICQRADSNRNRLPLLSSTTVHSCDGNHCGRVEEGSADKGQLGAINYPPSSGVARFR